eukprot:6499624-Pyramimonas_sp.AAC.1
MVQSKFRLLGEDLVAKSVVVLQRKDTMVVFQQMLFHNDTLIAQADITCVCIRYTLRGVLEL